eukprot:g11370.t1
MDCRTYGAKAIRVRGGFANRAELCNMLPGCCCAAGADGRPRDVLARVKSAHMHGNWVGGSIADQSSPGDGPTKELDKELSEILPRFLIPTLWDADRDTCDDIGSGSRKFCPRWTLTEFNGAQDQDASGLWCKMMTGREKRRLTIQLGPMLDLILRLHLVEQHAEGLATPCSTTMGLGIPIQLSALLLAVRKLSHLGCLIVDATGLSNLLEPAAFPLAGVGDIWKKLTTLIATITRREYGEGPR